MDADRLLSRLCPALCVVCRASCAGDSALCTACVLELNSESPIWADPPPGVDTAVSSFRHQGVARGLLKAFKFDRMIGLAPLMAGYMAEHIGPAKVSPAMVPVPATWLRRRLRGFDPAELLARQVAELLPSCRLDLGVIRRVGVARQRGRGRNSRIAAPPVIREVRAQRGPVLLVDDVITTGATMAACASALRRSGAGPITALSFTRRV